MKFINRLMLFGVVLFVGCGGCGGQPEFCKGLELTASQGQPLDLVPIALDLEVDEGEEPIEVGELFAEVRAKGEDPYYTAIEQDVETGDYALVVPAHPDGIEGGQVKLLIHGSNGTCRGKEKFEILSLDAAPGTMELVVEKMKDVMRLQTEKLGYTMEDLETDDFTELPEPLWGHASSLDAIDGPDNPNSLIALANDDAEVDVGEGLELANALLAKANIPGRLDAAAATLEAVEEPDEPLQFGMADDGAQPSALRTKHQSLCSDLILRPLIDGPYALSYYMKLADAAKSELESGQAARLDTAGTLMGALPHPAFKAAAMLLTAVAFYQKSSTLAYSNTLPSTIVNPEVELTKTWFEEDSEEAGSWKDEYEVSAGSNGWDATATILEGVVNAIESAISSKGLADELATAVRNDDIAGDLASIAGSNGTKAFLSNFENGCVFPPWTWGPVNVSDTIFSEVEYELAIKAQQGNRWGYVPRDIGDGTITLNVVPAAFPPATNKLASLLVEDVEVREIIVTLDPGYGRIEPGKSIEVRAIVRNAVDKGVEFKLLEPQNAGADVEEIETDLDPDGNVKATVTGATEAKDYPVRIKATSTSRGGLRKDSPGERGDFGRYKAEAELILSPAFACVEPGKTEDYKAYIAGSDDTTLNWEPEGGTISGTDDEVTYKARTEGVHTIRATHEDLGVSDTATVVVNQCECEFDVLVNGMVFAQFGGYLNINATTNGDSLTIGMQDDDDNRADIISLAQSGHGVNPGVPGTYDAVGSVALEGSQSVVDTFNTVFSGSEEDNGAGGQLTIETWDVDGHYITGRFDGRAMLFYTIAGEPDERVWVDITIHFRTFVNETTDILGLAEYSCHNGEL